MLKKKKTNHSKTIVSLSMVAMLSLLSDKPAKAGLVNFSCPQPLLFGGFTACSTGPNTVVLSPGGGRAVGGCLTAGGAPFANAVCNVVQDGLPRPVVFNVTAATRTLTAGANTMTYNNFNFVGTATGFFVSIPIGATLNVSASQPGGTYTGSFVMNATLL